MEMGQLRLLRVGGYERVLCVRFILAMCTMCGWG